MSTPTCESRRGWRAWSGQCCCCRSLRWEGSKGPSLLTQESPAAWCCSTCPCSSSRTSADPEAAGNGWPSGCPGCCCCRHQPRHHNHWRGPDNSCNSQGQWASGTLHLTWLVTYQASQNSDFFKTICDFSGKGSSGVYQELWRLKRLLNSFCLLNLPFRVVLYLHSWKAAPWNKCPCVLF